MKQKIRRRIITETKQIAAIINSTDPENISCEICGESVKMVTPLNAAQILRISTREIYRSIENGNVHFIEFSNKQMFVCINSLRQTL